MSSKKGRAPHRSMNPVQVRRRQRALAVVIASVVLILGTAGWVVWAVSTDAVSNDFAGTGNGELEMVEVPEGASVSALGPELEERGIVKSDGAFQSAAISHPDAGSIQPGFYRLQKEMSGEAAVNALLDTNNRVDLLEVNGGDTLMDTTVVGGDTRFGIYSKIADVTCSGGGTGCVQVADLHRVAATKDPATLGVPEWAVGPVAARGNDPKRLEGLISPGQYIIDPRMSAEEILTDLITRSAEFYNSTGIVERAQAIGLSPYDLLTAASLVEREAPAGDFDKVARVILNRLAKPMRLEFDSTVNYGLESQEVATTDEDRGRKTPWNTYASDGLPATPIASPSDEAVTAMERPAEGQWLFFVTVDKDGTTVFNDTFEQHEDDVHRALESGVLDSNR